MKYPLALFLCGSFVFSQAALAGDPKVLPNQAGNDDLDIEATAVLTPADIRQALDGTGLDMGYIVVRVKAIPKSDKGVRLGPDDFTLLSRKDGQRSPALAPTQIAGGGSVLVVRPANDQPRGDGTAVHGPVWGGVSVRKTPGSSDSSGGTPTEKSTGAQDSPLLKTLTEKSLPDKEIKAPTEGLLYFGIEGKLKPKDLSLLYNGQAGKLVIDFK